MPNKLIDEVWDLDSIKAQLQEYLGFLAAAKKGMQDLYDYQKSFKDTTISNLTENTQQLSVVIGQAAASTNKASQANQGLADSIKAVATAGTNLNETYAQASTSLDANIKTQIRYRAEVDALKDSQKLLQAQIAAVGGATDSQSAKQVELVKNISSVTAASKDLQRTIQAQIKEQTSATGSVDQMKASLSQLTQAYDKLGKGAQGSEGGKELQATIQQVNAALTELEVKTGRSQRKVGDYTGAVATLEEQLKLVNAQLTEMAAKAPGGGVQNLGGNTIGFKQGGQPGSTTALAGGTGIGFDPQRYKQLQQESEALTVVINRQGKGFASVTQQIRQSEQALQTLAAAGLEGTQGFEKLRASTVSAAQAQKEFIRQERLLESEAPALGAIALAAKGLAGAYAVGAGAQALFADGNEKVEKELNKLVAIMTILQGLEEAYQFINKSGSATLAIKNSLLKAANATMKENIVAQEAISVANAQATAAQEAATAAAGEEAVALQAEADAALEAAAALEATTVAAAATQAAFIATGIGVLIVAVAAAAAYLIYKMKEWNAETILTIDEQKELNNALRDYEESLKAVSQLYENRPQTRDQLAVLEKQLALEEKSGQNQYKLFAIKEEIAKKNKEIADFEQVNAVSAAEDKYGGRLQGIAALKQAEKDYFEDYTSAQYKASIAQKNLAALMQLTDKEREEGHNKRNIEEAKELVDLSNAEAARTKAQYENAYDADKKVNDADRALQEMLVERQKFTADEQRKLTLALANARIDAERDANEKILSDDRTALSDRLLAMRSNRDLEIKAAEAQRAALDPHATQAEQEEADAELNEKKNKADLKYHQDVLVRTREFIKQRREDQLEAFAAEAQDREKNDQLIEAGAKEKPDSPFSAKKKFDLATRLNALGDEYAARRQVAANEREKELLDEHIDGTESIKLMENKEEKIKAINAKYNTEISADNVEFRDKYAQLEAQAIAASLQEWEMYYAKRQEQINEHADEQLTALNTSHEQGKRYTRDRAKIEDQAAVGSAENTVDQAKLERNSTQEGTKARVEANDKLAKSAEELSEKIRKQQEDAKNAVRDQVSEDIQNVESLGNSAEQVMEIGYNRQEIDLQNLEKHEARAHDVQMKQIQDSSASQEQKALRMKILDDQQTAQNEKNARKQRQLDIQKAKFDKEKSIMDIILNTAVAVTKALDDPFLEIAIIAAGAAELATAIATPLPKYKAGAGIAGRPEHAGGRALVGDAFVPELILEPGLPAYWSPGVPTVLDLAARTKVIPPEEIERMFDRGMFVNQYGVIRQGNESRHEMQQVREAIVWQTGRIERAIAKNRPRIVTNIKLDAKFGEHIHKSVFK